MLGLIYLVVIFGTVIHIVLEYIELRSDKNEVL